MGPVTWGIVHGVAGAAGKGRYHRLVDTYRLADIALQAVSLVRADLLYRFLLLQPSRIVAHLSAVVLTPLAGILHTCPGQLCLSFFTGAGRLRLFPPGQALLPVNFVSS
jgi:hypothetical protein